MQSASGKFHELNSGYVGERSGGNDIRYVPLQTHDESTFGVSFVHVGFLELMDL